MDTQKKKMEVIFVPGCFDDFEGTQEELDALVEQIKSAVESGDALENSSPIDTSELTDEDITKLEQVLENLENTYRRTLN